MFLIRIIIVVFLGGFLFSAMAVASPKAAKDRCLYMREKLINGQYRYKKLCPTNKEEDKTIDQYMLALSTNKKSAFQKRIDQEEKYSSNRFGIVFYEPTYILPYYNTTKPYASVYQGNTPEGQKVMSNEFKAQLSFKVPIWKRMFHTGNALNIAYTQLMYWQFYAKSQYFRETNYEPALFVSNNFLKNWQYMAGVVHQSNGRGGALERSWNRAYVDFRFSRGNWFLSMKPWIIIFKEYSSDLHNPDIGKYLGYERVVVAYKFHGQVLSLMFRNTVDSGFRRGAEELNYSFPLTKRLHGYIQVFSGYGQSLIEYDHYTNGIGVGLSLSNWL